ncbi:RpiB/LacA/LacB family sugar-phosphate isomerase, partial [Chloroflexota bacterium]
WEKSKWLGGNLIPASSPDIAAKVSRAVAGGDFRYGVLLCGTGIGMCMAANKVKGIRAALATDVFSARRAREHNDANILCMGAERVSAELAEEIVSTFLDTGFEGGRHQRRLDKMRDIEAR